MLLILEGSECCFKSTVAEKLHNKLGYKVTQGSHFKFATNGNSELYKRMISFAEMDNVILDRFIYSNLVYASLKKDYSILTPEQVQNIENMIRDKAIIVYLHAPSDVLVQRLEERGDEYIKSDELKGINEVYEQVMNNVVGMHLFSYDTSEYDSDYIANDIEYVVRYLNKGNII